MISRRTAGWQEDHDRWQRRDLSARRCVYIRADGVCLQARMEPQAECMLVIVEATPEGRKELAGFQLGVREGAQSGRELLVDLKARGLAVPPELAVGDGAPGFWKAGARSAPAPAISGRTHAFDGSTRYQTCSLISRNPCARPSRSICARSRRPKPAPRRGWPSRPSRRNTAPDTSAGWPA